MWEECDVYIWTRPELPSIKHKNQIQGCHILFNVQTPSVRWRRGLCAWRPVAGVDDWLCHLQARDVVHVEEFQHVLGVWVDLNDVHLNGRLLQTNNNEKLTTLTSRLH